MSTIATEVPGLDAAAAARWMARVHAPSPWLHEEVGRRMMERLQCFREPPQSWLDWEPVLGGEQVHHALRQRLGRVPVYVHANAQSAVKVRLEQVAPEQGWSLAGWLRPHRALDLAPDTQVDMLWANMVLHTQPRPLELMAQWFGRVRTGGFLMFSCLGPDSLSDLRRVHAQHGWPEPAHAFTDMHDLGDMLVAQGFAEPVMDMERIQLSYSSVDTLLADLRQLGRNLSAHRFHGLRGRAWAARWREALERGLPRDAEGRWLLGFEIVYGHAFKPQPRPGRAQVQTVSLDSLRANLRGRKS